MKGRTEITSTGIHTYFSIHDFRLKSETVSLKWLNILNSPKYFQQTFINYQFLILENNQKARKNRIAVENLVWIWYEPKYERISQGFGIILRMFT